jgi:transposase
MDHVAIDLGGRESQICARSSDGKVIEERRCATSALPRYLAKRDKCRVILETCAEAFAIADVARSQGHEVRVVSATLVRTLGVGSRGTKNDRKDAQVLSEVSCRIDLPSVHIPSTESRIWKAECGMREALVGARTQLINTVRGWLRRHAERIKAGGSATFASRVRAHLQAAGQVPPPAVGRQLETIEHLTAQIAQADRELKQRASIDERCRRLASVPGVGPVTAVRFVAALDQVGRFANAHAVQSYLGLVPGERSSSETIRHTSITKAGPSAVRWALVQACWVLRRRRPTDPLVRWCKQIEVRRGVAIAVVAMARKLAGILFAMWRDGTSYDTAKVSTLATQQEESARATLETALEMVATKRTSL